MILPYKGEASVFSRMVYATRDVVEVERNQGGKYGSNNWIEKQLVLSELENVVLIRGGGIDLA